MAEAGGDARAEGPGGRDEAPSWFREAGLAGLFDSMPLPVAAIDTGLRVVYANRHGLEAAGLARDDILGRSIGELMHPAMDERIRPILERLRAGQPVRWADWVIRGDGLRRYVEQVFSPCLDQAGSLTGFLVVTHDLTEAKLREEELQARLDRREAEQLAAMDALLSDVGHELGNPLAVLVAQATLLAAEAGGDARLTQRAERIHAAAERAGRIVKSFLTREPGR